MIHRPMGPDGVPVPAVGQGTWRIGGRGEADRQAVRSLLHGLDLGLALIDTAEMYGAGHAETLVGEAIRGRRDEVFLVSKVLPGHADRAGVIRALEASLRRLGTDHLDLYLLHWPSASVAIEETMEAMADLVAAGKSRMVGVSNFDGPELDEAVRALGRTPMACNQLLYWLGDRGIEWELLDTCRESRITVMAYSPFGQGALADLRGERRLALATVARRHGGTPHQAALAWAIRHDHVVAIPKASDPNHLRDNAAAAGWRLTPDDLDLLDRAFPPPRGPAPLGVL